MKATCVRCEHELRFAEFEIADGIVCRFCFLRNVNEQHLRFLSEEVRDYDLLRKDRDFQD